MTEAAVGRASARVALLGNPGDLYAGLVLAATIDAFETVVEVSRTTFYAPPAFLSDAAELQRLAFERVASGRAGCALTMSTTIPLRSGLSGSSAILIATLRALDAYYGLDLEPLAVARIAWEIERDELGAVAGPQDRVIQALGGLKLMDFSGPDPLGTVTELDPELLPPLLVAWPPASGTPSDHTHRSVWDRVRGGDDALATRIDEFASIARRGTAALASGDHAGFADAIDANFDLRSEIFELTAADCSLVEIARAAGGAAKFCGSGGAIVAMPRADTDEPRLRAALESAGASTHRLTVVSLSEK